MRVAVINVPISVGQDAWEKCWHATAARSGLFGINENLSRAQRVTYRRLADEHGWRRFGTESPNPVMWKRGTYRLVTGQVVKLHGRGPRYRSWPGFNAPRFATDVTLAPLVQDGRTLGVINTHWVPRGPKVPSWWRTWARARSKRLVARMVSAHVRAGHDVIVMGDFNISEPFRLISGLRWLAGTGVDKIGAAPASRIVSGSARHYRAPTDHGSGVVAEVEFR